MRASFFLGLMCVLTLLVYVPGLPGSFIFDDYPNIVNDPLLRQIAENLHQFESWKLLFLDNYRPIAFLSFSLNFLFTDGSAESFKLLNIFIHLLNVILVYWLTKLLLEQLTMLNSDQRFIFTILIAGIWGLHPIELTSVLYVVQRMNLLASLFVLLGMTFWLATDKSRSKLLLRIVGVALFSVLAYLSKENGALLPLYILIYEYCCGHIRSTRAHAGLAVIGIGLLLLYSQTEQFDRIFSVYDRRAWTLMERLLTESRVVASYIGWIIAPDIRALGLYHDGIQVSKTLFNPWTTLPSILLHSALIVLAAYFRSRVPLLCFGILFFYAGHLIESTVLPLELVHEHRNYLPSLGIILAIGASLIPLAQKYQLRKTILVGVATIAVFSSATAVRAWTWQSPGIHMWIEVQHHPGSARALVGFAGVFHRASQNAPNEELRTDFANRALQLYDRSTVVDPANFSGAFGRLLLRGHEPTAADVIFLKELAHRMHEQPYDVNNEHLLFDFALCSAAGKCNYGPEHNQAFLEDAIRHPNIQSSLEAATRLIAAMHAHDVLADDVRALELISPKAQEISQQRRLCTLYESLRISLLENTNVTHEKLPPCSGGSGRLLGSGA